MSAGASSDLAAAALAVARRFAAGATMWCVSPAWPEHARHIAVEFVHPVVVGKRALPAVHVRDVDPVATLRALARPGDIAVVIGAASDPTARSLARRAGPWGLLGVWIGAGQRPFVGSAEHVLWVDDVEAEVAARSGALIRVYHLLWELAQVVLEHPGALRPEPVCTAEVCITCADEGTLAEVATVVDADHAVVRAGGRTETIATTLVGDVAPGELVVVHAGMAIGTMEEGS